MQISQDFDEIRPYRDEEIPDMMNKLLGDPVFVRVLKKMFQDDQKLKEVETAMRLTNTVESFQLQFMVPFFDNIINSSTKGVIIEGLENLKKPRNILVLSITSITWPWFAYKTIKFFSKKLKTRWIGH